MRFIKNRSLTCNITQLLFFVNELNKVLAHAAKRMKLKLTKLR